MNETFFFTRVFIAPPPEDFLRLTPEERLKQNNLMANRLIALEQFMKKFIRGYNFIKSHHVHPR
ncbi:MAG TPA: hypothetical protein VGI63_04205 [Verrucomicrobiae bacterium]|jgi:hypothetical protein